MPSYKKLITPALLAYPKFKMENDINLKLAYFQMTDDGAIPVYEQTDEVSEEEALSIMLGEE